MIATESDDSWEDSYFENISFQTMTEDQYARMPLRRKLLFELEDKLGVEIPATRKYNHKAFDEGTVYLTNSDLIAIAKGVLEHLDAEPRFPLVALEDESD